jgi:Protein of unknown function (DUF2726)
MNFAVFNQWTPSVGVVSAVAVAVVALLYLQRRRRHRADRAAEHQWRAEQVDTVIGWPPQATRVMTSAQCRALHLLRRALPERLILAQVPLSHFIEVPTRHSNLEWMRRVGRVTADLMICDAQGRVLCVIDLRRIGHERSFQTRRRHERMARVLEAAQMPFYVWDEARLPTASTVRRAFGEDAVREGEGGAIGRMAISPRDQKDPPVSGWFDDLHATQPTKLDSVVVVRSDTMHSDGAPVRAPHIAQAAL